jgi:8-oxo-dGTP diphosphatase
MNSQQQAPITTVVAIIYKYKGDKEYILLTKRKVAPYKDYWCLPGGHIEKNESAEDAIIREVKEETDLDFSPEFYNYFDEIIPEEQIHSVPLIFVGISSGILLKSNEEVAEAIWVLLEDALKYNLAFHHNEILNEYKTNTPVKRNGNAILNELNYLRNEVLNRFEIRNKMIYYTIFLAGIILTFGKTEGFIFYPILGTVLAGLWSHSDIRIDDIADYIRTQIEPRINGLGWENHLHKKYQATKLRESKRQERYVLWVFYSTYIIMILFSGFRILQSLKEFINSFWKITPAAKADVLLFLAGILITFFCMIKTRSYIKKRRAKYSSRFLENISSLNKKHNIS